MNQSTINLAARVPVTEAEGPGSRFAIWVQGCPLRCPGCCNPHFLEEREAELVALPALLAEVDAVAEQIEGVTLLGGEPFTQAGALAEFCSHVRKTGLSVMAFTGYVLEDLTEPDHMALLDNIDLLVDGPYLREKHCTDRRWIGSSNQRVHFLTERYANLRANGDRPWDLGGNTIEIRFRNGELTINGFPHREVRLLGNRIGGGKG